MPASVRHFVPIESLIFAAFGYGGKLGHHQLEQKQNQEDSRHKAARLFSQRILAARLASALLCCGVIFAKRLTI
ncbi:MAG: hypothetical protein JO138_03930 [Acidobacteriaceae bacterium]|nr:hypothetical protein [Acidobacteriaceae bacterium]